MRPAIKGEEGRKTAQDQELERPLNIADRIRAMAAARPWSRAVVSPEGRDARGRRCYAHLTFKELDELCDTYARGLSRLGIEPGMRCLLMVKPTLEFFALAFAVYRLGAVTVMIDPAMGRRNVLGAIEEVEAEALIGIPKAHVARTLFPKAFRSLRVNVTVGKKVFWGGSTLADVTRLGEAPEPFAGASTRASDMAAILFTSGSTGVPKGVVYTHAIFDAQVQIFEEDFGIEPGEVDLSAFPLFSLFSCALGVTCVIPDMDATQPAQVDPRNIVEAVADHGVTYAFGSPVFWHLVAEHCEKKGLSFPSMRRLLMAGAPAPVSLLERSLRLVGEDGDVFTPYGATESLPVSLPSAREILDGLAEKTKRGAGTCVGRPVGRTEVRVIEITDSPIERLDGARFLPPNEIGELIVTGPVTTMSYFRRPQNDALAKIRDGDVIWHRMGDVGYVDEQGRIWFCGRKSHRVRTERGTMFTVCCEAIFNGHPRVYRSALVGVGQPGRQRPVIIIECHPHARPNNRSEEAALVAELRQRAQGSKLTDDIEDVLFHPSFPVDARHNAKIRREDLAVWAELARS